MSTLAMLPVSSRIWPRPDLARPWAPALFGVKNGSRKKWFCDEIILWWVGREIPIAQMNSIVYKTHLGRLLCPKPYFFEEFCVISFFSRKLGRPPAYLLVGSLFCPWDPYCALWILWRAPFKIRRLPQLLCQGLQWQASAMVTCKPTGPYFVRIGIPRAQ